MLPFVDRDISLEHLETVHLVSENGNFTRTAEMLHLSQPAVTRGVQEVEEALETILLDRANRPATLTQAGEDFRYETRKGLYFIMRGFRKARCAGRERKSILEIGHCTYLDPNVMTYLANVAKSPQVGFSALYHSSGSGDIVAKVQGGLWDCGFVVGPVHTLDLHSIPVMRDPLCLVISGRHPLAQKRVLELKDLFNQRLILPSRDSNPAFHAWLIERLERAGVTPRIVQEVSHPQEGILLASESIGVAVTNRSAAETMRKGLAVWRRLDDAELAIEIQFVMRRETCSEPLAAFVETVKRLQKVTGRPGRRKEPASVRSGNSDANGIPASDRRRLRA